MTDAIDRGEILRELMEIKKEAALTAASGRISKDVENRAVAIADLFAELVQKIPALDVVPVVHARWDDQHRCTECICLCTTLKAPQGHLIFVETPYCSNCGAKMDGEENAAN